MFEWMLHLYLLRFGPEHFLPISDLDVGLLDGRRDDGITLSFLVVSIWWSLEELQLNEKITFL